MDSKDPANIEDKKLRKNSYWLQDRCIMSQNSQPKMFSGVLAAPLGGSRKQSFKGAL